MNPLDELLKQFKLQREEMERKSREYERSLRRDADLALYRKIASSKLRLTGRPNRDTVINDNDIINLKIQMEISPDLDTFLKSI